MSSTKLTGSKVSEAIMERAKGNVLVIDEAYGLKGASGLEHTH